MLYKQHAHSPWFVLSDTRSTIREDIWNVPNALTMARIAVIPIVCWMCNQSDPVFGIVAVVLFGLAAFTDWLDGYIARKRNLVSMTGKFLDPLADKLLVMAVVVTLLPMGRLPVWFVVLMLAREMSINGLRALAASEGIVIASGWGGKWKTGFQFVGLSCLLINFVYRVDFGVFTLDINFNRVGFALMLASLAYSYHSAWEYLRGFWEGVGVVKTVPEPAVSD
jgi:CDP-diacylglycerol--glycerol-3-phosphate 3-phosphatidyltransferase